MIAPGTLVEYLQGKRLAAGICLRAGKPGIIFVRTDRGGEEKLAENKVIFSESGAADPNASFSEIDERLAKAVSHRETLSQSVNIPELWELLADEEAGKVWELEELCELSLGEAGKPERSGLYRALERDRFYFVRKGSGYVLRSREHINDLMRQQETEAANKLERDALKKWLLNIWQNPLPQAHAELKYPEGFEAAAAKIFDGFEDVALYGTDSMRLKDTQAILKEIDVTRRDAPFRFLVKAGLWSEHENLLLHKFAVKTSYEPEVEEAAAELRVDPADLLACREDLRHLECVTIDDESTTEIDDALSFETLEDGYRVGVHIADVAEVVKSGASLDDEALARGTAIYLPDLKVRMLPSIISDDICSLVAGTDRLAFSFIAEFDASFNMRSVRMAETVINVHERLTYTQADEMLESGRWPHLLDLAKHLRLLRQEDGAFTVPFPRINVKVSSSGEIIIERETPNAPSQVIVSEMMILANRTAAEYLAKHNVPAIYRSQEPPEQELSNMEEYDAAKAYACRRFMHKGVMGLKPSRHSGLGLDYYMQITSPIRRYNDLLMQRQIKAVLRGGEAPYSEEDLADKLASTRQSAATADTLEKDRRGYWIMRWLEERQWKELNAVVVANHPDKHIVQINDCLWETECALVPGHPLPPGSPLQVRIEVVWPRDQIVRVTPVV
ncbi:MAG: RNB domain-containing ribonuclease [bacterium]|nr:RNB domain-containing ribonuclease [bacterium]